MKKTQIPPTTIARLPLYLRCLQNVRSQQKDLVSSFDLAQLVGSNAAQLRKDLSYLGEFGTRGVGYDVDELILQISKWLGVTTTRSVVIVGMGKLGQALGNYQGFSEKNFRIIGVYDVDLRKIGEDVAGLRIRHLDELGLAENGALIDIGIIATPAESAQGVADRLVRAGVKSILNFAPATLDVPPNVCVRHVDLSTELQIIGFHLSRTEQGLVSDCCD